MTKVHPLERAERVEQAAKMRRDGYGRKSIAETLGVTLGTVSGYLRDPAAKRILAEEPRTPAARVDAGVEVRLRQLANSEDDALAMKAIEMLLKYGGAKLSKPPEPESERTGWVTVVPAEVEPLT